MGTKFFVFTNETFKQGFSIAPFNVCCEVFDLQCNYNAELDPYFMFVGYAE